MTLELKGEINMLTIKVTQEDIGNGIKGNSTSCPIGLAIQEKLGLDSSEVYVDGATISLGQRVSPTFTGSYTIYQLSKIGYRFTERFDILKKVKPHTFRFRDA